MKIKKMITQNQIIEPNKLAEKEIENNHIVLPYKSSLLFLFGLSSQDQTFYDGSCHQYKGHKRSATFNIGLDKNQLDAPVKRVGFMGVDNDKPLEKELPSTAEYQDGLWNLCFEIYRNIVWVNQKHYIQGAFYVETTKNTYYWLKDKGEKDFEFNWDSKFTLNDWYPDV